MRASVISRGNRLFCSVWSSGKREGGGWLWGAGLLLLLAMLPLRAAQPTSFEAVTRQLDPGGTLFVYLSTERCLSDLSGATDRVRDEVLDALRGAGVGGQELDNIGRAFRSVSGFIERSGVESLTGIGLSGLEVREGVYRTKMFAHRRGGVEPGYGAWLFGRSPHRLESAGLLPATTVYAAFHDLDMGGIWSAVEREFGGSGFPGAVRGLEDLRQTVERGVGMSMADFLGSLGGEVGVVCTLHEDREVAVPLPSGETLMVGEPRIGFVVKVKDDRLFQRLEELLGGGGMDVLKVDEDGVRIRSVEGPFPLPFEVRPSVARFGDYLVLASSDELVREMALVRRGGVRGLVSAPGFRSLAEGLDLEGNGFGYVDRRLTETLVRVQRAFLAEQASMGGGRGGVEAAMLGLVERWMGAQQPMEELSVSANTEDGWKVVTQGNREPAQTLVAAVGVAPVAILAGMTLPALANAKTKAQSIACVNNMKQICLGARIYATDHEDVFPPDVSSMEAELFSPRVLFCPEDPMRPDPLPEKWGDVDFDNISYEYLMPGASAVDDFDPRQVMFRCRHHGHVGQADGAVIQSR
ncbi:MAG: hypothetical protein RI897_4334 [Verrucomicrobiota bacterium]